MTTPHTWSGGTSGYFDDLGNLFPKMVPTTTTGCEIGVSGGHTIKSGNSAWTIGKGHSIGRWQRRAAADFDGNSAGSRLPEGSSNQSQALATGCKNTDTIHCACERSAVEK